MLPCRKGTAMIKSENNKNSVFTDSFFTAISKDHASQQDDELEAEALVEPPVSEDHTLLWVLGAASLLILALVIQL